MHTPKQLKAAAKAGIPTEADENNASIAELQKWIEKEMNKKRAVWKPVWHDFALVSQKHVGIRNPAFFSQDTDIIYFRLPIPDAHFPYVDRTLVSAPKLLEHAQIGDTDFSGMQWRPLKHSHSADIKSFALEIDYFAHRPQMKDTTHYLCRKWWWNVPDYKSLTGLQTLYLVCIGDREVLELELDNRLLPGEWNFELAKKSPDSRKI